jgi:hypothetical protein
VMCCSRAVTKGATASFEITHVLVRLVTLPASL